MTELNFGVNYSVKMERMHYWTGLYKTEKKSD